MVLEAVLYFVLGLLSAGLLALMLAPAIWNRAVVLTKRRIESSVPLTLNEIQADKDQLRAEFAMSTRRLEMSIDELRETANSQLVEINRKRDEMAKLARDGEEKIAKNRELESQASNLRVQLADREKRIEALSGRESELNAQLEALAVELEQHREKLEASEEQLHGQRIELVAREAEIDTLKLGEAGDEDGTGKPAGKQKREVATLKAKLTNEKKRSGEQALKIERLEKQTADLIQELERREKDIGEIRSTVNASDGDTARLMQDLLDEKTRVVELEAKLARKALQTEALLNDASNENVQNILSGMTEEREKQANLIAELTAERDALAEQLGRVDKNAAVDWASERRDNAILRERMNDMAAQVTAMAAEFEGKDSPINAALASGNGGQGTKPAGKSASAKSRSKAKEAESAKSRSLADRIRALQQQNARSS